MPKVRIGDDIVDVPAEALFADDGVTPFGTPTPPAGQQYFTVDDITKAREDEKNKLYGRIESLTQTITGLEEKVGTLTSAEQQRLEAAQAEQARLEEEARKREEQDLDAKTLLERKEQDWNKRLQDLETSWSSKLEAEKSAREQAEALQAKEREFHDLQQYTQSQIEANKDSIAPQFYAWINGNNKEEIDAAIARAVASTSEILEEIGQAQPPADQYALQFPQAQPPVTQQPVPVGVRPHGGPANFDPAGQQTQQLTPEQIANMDMTAYAELRKRMGIGGQSNNRGLFG